MSALLAHVANRRRPIDHAGSQCDGLRQGPSASPSNAPVGRHRQPRRHGRLLNAVMLRIHQPVRRTVSSTSAAIANARLAAGTPA